MARFRPLRLLFTSAMVVTAACGTLLGVGDDDDAPGSDARADASDDRIVNGSGSRDGDLADVVDAREDLDAATEARDAADAKRPTELPDSSDVASDGSVPCAECATTSGYCHAGGQCDPVVFVTAETYTGDMSPQLEQGTGGPDAKCQASAAAAGLPGKYIAWIAANTSPASLPWDRITPVPGPYRLVDGRVVVDSFDLFQRGQKTIRTAISLTAKRTKVDPASEVWTGLDRLSNPALYDCNQWVQTSQKGEFAVVAACTAPAGSSICDGVWTSAKDAGDCKTPRHLYCVQTQ